MKQILEALHLILTGVDKNDIPEKGDPWQPCIVAGLRGLNVIMGFDRTENKMPDSAFPYLLIEPTGIQPTGTPGAKTGALIFDIGVRQTGRLGALLGNNGNLGLVDYAGALYDFIEENMALRTTDGKFHASGASVKAVDFTAKGSSGPWSAKRYATFTVEYNFRRK